MRVRWAVLLTAAWLLTACGGHKPPASKPDPDRDLQQTIRMADSYFRNGRASEAIDMLEEATKRFPQNAQLVNYHGQLCLLAGRLPQAEESFRKALAIDPYLTDAHNNLGAVLDKTGKKTEAEEEFRKALADPTYASPQNVHLNLGLLYASQERNEDAVREMRKAVEIDPKFYRGQFELASLLDKLGQLDEAVRLYEVAAPAYRQDGSYQYRVGLAYFRLDRKDQAKAHLEKVLEIAPGSESAAKAGDLLRMIP